MKQLHATVIMLVFVLLISVTTTVQACLTDADKAPCDDMVNITELMDHIGSWYKCSSCVPDIFQSIQAYYNIPFCGDNSCDVGAGEDCSACPGDCGCGSGYRCVGGSCVEENVTFSFMWLGDDNAGGAATGLRYGYTQHPDIELIFYIPDLGRDRAYDYNVIHNEWQNNPNSDPAYTPVFFGLGNHDLESIGTVNYTSEVLGPNLMASRPGMTNFMEGPYDTYPNGYDDRNLTYSFDYKNSHFVMINGYYNDIQLDLGSLNGACGSGTGSSLNRFDAAYAPVSCMSDSMINWLDNDLSSTDADFKFLFMHEAAHPPPGGRHTGDSMDCLSCPGNYVASSWINATRPMREKYWGMLAKNNVTAVFVGHSHHTTATWVNDVYYNNGAVYEVESGHPPRTAVVEISGSDATLRLYGAYSAGGYVYYEPFGPIKLSMDAINDPPKLFQHRYGVDAGWPVIGKQEYTFEEGQGTSAYLYFEAKDSDVDDDLQFSFNGLPPFYEVNGYIQYLGVPEWTDKFRRLALTTNTADPSNRLTSAEVGNYSFDVVVSDGQAQDVMDFNISVMPAVNPVVLGASIPNNTVIQFPMNSDRIYFFCRDDESGASAPRYPGYTVKYNGVDVSCCSVWHSYGTKQLTDNLAFSEFLFPDDWDGVKDVSPGRYDVTIRCGDRASHTSDPYTLTVYLSNQTAIPNVYGTWPYDGATVDEMTRFAFWAPTGFVRSTIPALEGMTTVMKDGALFNDYYIATTYLNGSGAAWGPVDIIFDSPAQDGLYEFDINGEVFTVTVSGSGAQPPGNNIYVDNALSGDCGDYDPGSGLCGGGTEQAYDTLAEAANAAVAGETVQIRGGTYNEILRPANSGTSQSPITFQGYGNEGVVITGTAVDSRLASHPDDPNYNYGPIWFENVSHIVVDRLNFSNIEGYGRISISHNNTFRNCNFLSSSGNWIIGLNLFESHDNRFESNMFEGTSDNFRIIHSDRNVFENNKFYEARHVLLTFKCSSYNVVRGNYLYNLDQKAMEVLDCEQPTMFDHYNIYYQDTVIVDSAKYNLIEENEFAYTPPDDGGGPYNHIQYAGQNGIIRNNLFYDSHGIALGMTRYGVEASYNMHNRVYSNVFYDNMGGGVITGTSSDPAHWADNIFKNNIFYKNYPIPIGWADNHLSATQISHHDMANFRFEYNNIINTTPGEGDVIWDYYNHRISLAAAESTYPSLYANNVELNPDFVNEAGYDFHLQSGSQMIDAGTFLTITVGPGSGTSMQVSDAGYFFDGYGIHGEVGDVIQLDGQVSTARVTKVDHSTNILTLDQSLDWSAGQGVSLAYSGSQPDMGAFEY